MNSRVIRTQDTIQKSRMHVSKFLTPLAPLVEKIVNLYGFR